MCFPLSDQAGTINPYLVNFFLGDPLVSVPGWLFPPPRQQDVHHQAACLCSAQLVYYIHPLLYSPMAMTLAASYPPTGCPQWPVTGYPFPPFPGFLQSLLYP